MIKFADLYAQHKELNREIKEAFQRVIKRSDFILGEEVKIFENEFAKFCHARFAVGVSSGTAAIFLALKALGIGEKDEVIVPDFTYIATALAVSYTGAKPVFADIREDTYNIDTEKIKKAITKNTKAIIPVHLYGQPAEMPEILKIAKKYNLKVVEDAAQAHGSSIKMPDAKWHSAGSIGDIGCFSFYPTKNLGAMGDGGIVTTNDEKIYADLISLRDYGRVSKYEHTRIGYNSRLDTLQAAILRAKLKRLGSWNKTRMKAAHFYDKYLKGAEGVITPYVAPRVRHVYHVYAIRIKRRQELCRIFQKKGIGAIIHYPIPLHLQQVYRDLGYKKGGFPVSERVAGEIISLPMHPYLKEKEIKFVADTIKEAVKN